MSGTEPGTYSVVSGTSINPLPARVPRYRFLFSPILSRRSRAVAHVRPSGQWPSSRWGALSGRRRGLGRCQRGRGHRAPQRGRVGERPLARYGTRRAWRAPGYDAACRDTRGEAEGSGGARPSRPNPGDGVHIGRRLGDRPCRQRSRPTNPGEIPPGEIPPGPAQRRLSGALRPRRSSSANDRSAERSCEGEISPRNRFKRKAFRTSMACQSVKRPGGGEAVTSRIASALFGSGTYSLTMTPLSKYTRSPRSTTFVDDRLRVRRDRFAENLTNASGEVRPRSSCRSRARSRVDTTEEFSAATDLDGLAILEPSRDFRKVVPTIANGRRLHVSHLVSRGRSRQTSFRARPARLPPSSSKWLLLPHDRRAVPRGERFSPRCRAQGSHARRGGERRLGAGLLDEQAAENE